MLDWGVLRSRMEIIVGRILQELNPSLKNVKISKHVEHQYNTEMTMRSNITNLGVIDADPSSHDGVLAIIQRLQVTFIVLHGRLDIRYALSTIYDKS